MREGGEGELFNGYRVLILQNEKVLPFGYIPMYIYLSLLTISLKMVIFYLIYIFPQFKKLYNFQYSALILTKYKDGLPRWPWW